MTIRELIGKLEQFPEDVPVMVHGYENGFDLVTDVSGKSTEKVQGNVAWYDGEYTEIKQGALNAVVIFSKRRLNCDDD